MAGLPKITGVSHLTGMLQHGALATKHDKLVKQSQRLVSQAFFGAMLKQMRESPFKSKIFEGGEGGKAFSSLLDQHLADAMAVGAGRKLSNALVHKLESRGHDKKKSATPTTKKAHIRSRFDKSGYRRIPGGAPHASLDRRPDVTADFRA